MNELKFDKIVKSNLEDIAVIEYGIIEGNNTIVFIKSGQNGSIYGYNNKYIKMAKRLNKKLYVHQIHLMEMILLIMHLP